MDINDPRNPNDPNRIHPDLPPGMTTNDNRVTAMWPIIAIVAALVAGLLFFGTNRADQPTTQVGQNVERPTTPNSAPTTPSTTPKQQ
jgi:hypothetical protein